MDSQKDCNTNNELSELQLFIRWNWLYNVDYNVAA